MTVLDYYNQIYFLYLVFMYCIHTIIYYHLLCLLIICFLINLYIVELEPQCDVWNRIILGLPLGWSWLLPLPFLTIRQEGRKSGHNRHCCGVWHTLINMLWWLQLQGKEQEIFFLPLPMINQCWTQQSGNVTLFLHKLYISYSV